MIDDETKLLVFVTRACQLPLSLPALVIERLLDENDKEMILNNELKIPELNFVINLWLKDLPKKN